MPASNERDLKFQDDSSVKETFVDGVHLVQFSDSTAKIVLTTSRLTETNDDGTDIQGYKSPSARLVLTPTALAALYSRLDQVMNALEAKGLVERTSGEASPGTMQ